MVATPIIDMASPAQNSVMYPVSTVERTFSLSFAPKYWATSTVVPIVRPVTREIMRNITGKAMPTAASAVVPTKLPTTMLSTMV